MEEPSLLIHDIMVNAIRREHVFLTHIWLIIMIKASQLAAQGYEPFVLHLQEEWLFTSYSPKLTETEFEFQPQIAPT